MKKHLFAVPFLIIALAATQAVAQQKMSLEESKAELQKFKRDTCKDFQLFASPEEQSPLKWVGTLDEKECHAKFDAKPSGSAKVYVDGFLESPQVAEGIQKLCEDNKEYKTPEACLEAFKSDELNAANAQLRLYNTAFGVAQHICSAAIKEKAGLKYHAAAGVCIPTALPAQKTAEWKEFMEEVYHEMNALPRATVAERCVSFAGSSEKFPVLAKLTNLFPLQGDVQAALKELNTAGYACADDAQDTSLHRCSKTYHGFRFLSSPQIPGGLEIFSSADTVEIALRSDKVKTSDICANIITVGR